MDVRDLMTRRVITVGPDTTLKEAIRLMDRHRVSGLPVVDASERLLGVLSETDVLVKEAGTTGQPRSRFAWLLGDHDATIAVRSKVDAATVAEAMTSPALTIAADELVHEAAALMLSRRINRLPVVDDGRLVGIITRTDVARAFLRSDAEIGEIVREDIIRRTLWVDPKGLRVSVDNGIVRIAGTVERRSTAELLIRLVRRLEGVIRVEAELTWTLDDADLDAPGRDLVHAAGA
ncbi:MAG TPA: CBS domain-containing protein [Candidatus Limnocylindrales bacterium]|jgi:CBS domain-containing protein